MCIRDSVITQYKYDDEQNLAQIDYSGRSVQQFEYDEQKRLVRKQTYNKNGDLLSEVALETYDYAEHDKPILYKDFRRSQGQWVPVDSITYEYDSLLRLSNIRNHVGFDSITTALTTFDYRDGKLITEDFHHTFDSLENSWQFIKRQRYLYPSFDLQNVKKWEEYSHVWGGDTLHTIDDYYWSHEDDEYTYYTDILIEDVRFFRKDYPVFPLSFRGERQNAIRSRRDSDLSGTVWTEYFYSPIGTVSVSEPLDKATLHMYPMPAEVTLSAELSSGAIATFCLYDLNGGKLLCQASGQMDVSGLPSGVYMAEVVNRSGVRYVEKVVISRH